MRTHLRIEQLRSRIRKLTESLDVYKKMPLPLSPGDQEAFRKAAGDLQSARLALVEAESESLYDDMMLKRPAPAPEAAGMTREEADLLEARPMQSPVEMRLTEEEEARERAKLRKEDEDRRRVRRDPSPRWMEHPVPVWQIRLAPVRGRVDEAGFRTRPGMYEIVGYIRAASASEVWHRCQNTPAPWIKGEWVIEQYFPPLLSSVPRGIEAGDVIVCINSGSVFMIDESLEKLSFRRIQ